MTMLCAWLDAKGDLKEYFQLIYDMQNHIVRKKNNTILVDDPTQARQLTQEQVDLWWNADLKPKIKNVKVYDHALSDEEIQELCNDMLWETKMPPQFYAQFWSHSDDFDLPEDKFARKMFKPIKNWPYWTKPTKEKETMDIGQKEFFEQLKKTVANLDPNTVDNAVMEENGTKGEIVIRYRLPQKDCENCINKPHFAHHTPVTQNDMRGPCWGKWSNPPMMIAKKGNDYHIVINEFVGSKITNCPNFSAVVKVRGSSVEQDKLRWDNK